ncbi:MAG: LysR family transcriptional regulator [Pseudomonadota bacterium]
MDKFTSMQLFLAVARHGTFGAAAEEMNMSRAMASKRIRALEEELGVRLFDRTTRAARLTEAGEEYQAHLIEFFAGLDEVEAKLTSTSVEVSGTLNVAAPIFFGSKYVSAIVARFMAQHPRVQVRCVLTDRSVDLIGEGIDVAIQIRDLDDSSFIARQIAATRMITCASAHYLEQAGVPATPRELKDHQCVIFNETATRFDAEWTFAANTRAEPIRVAGNFVANAGEAVAKAATAGQGIARLPEYIVASAIEKQQLIPILEQFEPPPRPIFAIYPHRNLVPAKVRQFLAFATDALKERGFGVER